MLKSKYIILSILLLGSTFSGLAGNPDRVGQAGATELLINPWARSSGWHGAFTSGIIGVEAMRFNVAGLIGIKRTEFLFSRTNYLQNSGIYFNSFGFAQRLGTDNAIGVSVMAMDAGDIEITTADMPEGGLGTFSPSFINIGAAYSRNFSNSIKGGALFRVVTEGIGDVSATGVAIDAGIQYYTDITGKGEDRSKFGISLRNIGTPMKYSGTGLVRRAEFTNNDFSQSVDTRANSFELPSQLNIGISQDFYFDSMHIHKLVFAANFVSNSFSKDQIAAGFEYSFKEYVSLRVGLVYEKDMFSSDNRTSVYTGPSAGFGLNLPFGKEDDQGQRKSFGIDYSYRATDAFSGIHSLGARLTL